MNFGCKNIVKESETERKTSERAQFIYFIGLNV